MPRPKRCRRIACYPDYWGFTPEGDPDTGITIITLEEYETIRLIDYEGRTQVECAAEMEVSRTTVTAIYDSARKKVAEALVKGRRLVISGGHYRIVHRNAESMQALPEKGNKIMRIAVTYEDGAIFQHFGHTEQFKFYDVEDGKVADGIVCDTNGQGHGALAGFLQNAQVDALICGGIGGGAQRALEEAGIRLYAGVSGSVEDAVNALVEGRLQAGSTANCNHHGNDCSDHGAGGNCGGKCH